MCIQIDVWVFGKVLLDYRLWNDTVPMIDSIQCLRCWLLRVGDSGGVLLRFFEMVVVELMMMMMMIVVLIVVLIVVSIVVSIVVLH